MIWACDATGRVAHNKKHTKYDGDGNPTLEDVQINEMADKLKSDMLIYGINPEMATDRKRWAVMVEKRRHRPDGRRRKRLVTVSPTEAIRIMMGAVWWVFV